MKIGILGGGQLARMMIQAGAKLGLEFRIFCSQDEEPTRVIPGVDPNAFSRVVAPYDDEASLQTFANGLDVVTFEFENVPARTLEVLSKLVPTRPSSKALAIGQDREQEKNFFVANGIATTKFKIVSNEAELRSAIAAVGLPAVIKTTRLGYDGKGQTVVRSEEQAVAALKNLGTAPFIFENLIPFSRELSCLAARAQDGTIRYYPLVENRHEGGILRQSLAPAPNTSETALEKSAHESIAKVLRALEYCGVLAIEFFEVDGKLVANEMAPRVHNSGHWTIEGAVTSQFENHIRAVAGLPLGDTAVRGNIVMENIIGEIPDWKSRPLDQKSCLHLYDKTAKAGRKLGHITTIN